MSLTSKRENNIRREPGFRNDPQEMFHVEHFASKKTGILTSRLFGGASAPFALVS